MDGRTDMISSSYPHFTHSAQTKHESKYIKDCKQSDCRLTPACTLFWKAEQEGAHVRGQACVVLHSSHFVTASLPAFQETEKEQHVSTAFFSTSARRLFPEMFVHWHQKWWKDILVQEIWTDSEASKFTRQVRSCVQSAAIYCNWNAQWDWMWR